MKKLKMPKCNNCDMLMAKDDPRPFAVEDFITKKRKYYCTPCQKNLKEALR